jgi:hypothetical protein
LSGGGDQQIEPIGIGNRPRGLDQAQNREASSTILFNYFSNGLAYVD